MILLDTNVLVYAVGADHPLRDRCRRLLDAQSEDGELATTLGVLEEFVHVRSARRPRRDAVTYARVYSVALTIVDVSVDDLDDGFEIYLAHPQVDSRDAVLAALAIHREEVLVSADRAFALIPGLRHVDPATPDLDRLIRARG